MVKKLIIIGESHTRQFAYRKNIIPLFSGNGKNINLDNPDIVQEKINRATDSEKYDLDALKFLYIGEPNCRIKLAGHWTPHWDEILHGKKISSNPNKEYLQKCINTYKKLNLSKIDYIITPTAAYDPVIPSLVYFNELLKQEFGDRVIDVFGDTYNKENLVKKEFKANNWEKDPIHLNSRVSEVFLKKLQEKGIINDIDNYSLEIESHFGTHIIFEKDKTRFGTYLIR